MSEHSTVPKLVVNRNEAADMLGLSTWQFTRRVSEGLAPAPFKIGGSVRWCVADIKAQLEARPVDPKERLPRSVSLGPNVCHLYRHFDKDGRLLYVGISLSAIARLAEHKQQSAWFWQIAKIEVTAYPTREAALKAERICIQRERPAHNVIHSRRAA